MLVSFFRLLQQSWRLGWLAIGLAVPVAAQSIAAASPEASHCLLLPLSPAQRLAQAALVVEAQVLDAQGEWDARHQHLFTRHRLRVFRVLQGSVPDTASLSILTEGGRLGLRQQVLTNTLRLEPGQQGVFFLAAAPWPGLPGAGPHYTPYGSEQGFIEYHPADGTASEPYRTYPAVDAVFYETVAGRSGLTSLPRWQPGRPQARGTATPAITALAPAQLPAGTGEVLTITGTDFGAARGAGYVEFRNADDGGATRTQARAEDYLAWTDTQIRVRVPSAGGGGHPAGSGPVRVTTTDQQAADSPTAIRVVYALTNVQSSDGRLLQRPNHVAQNGSGGVSFHFGPGFAANAAASAAWQRALANWRCHSGMNWEVAAPATTDAIADDGQNVVAFDQTTPGAGTTLPANVLGRTTSYYNGCYGADGNVVFYVDEVDMQFSGGANFQFGPLPAVAPQIDFETVAVHELGHAQQLSHLILPGAIMHYAVARGQNARTLTAASDIAGGRRVLRERSFRYQGCGGPALLPAPLTSLAASYVPGSGPLLRWTTRDECFLTDFVVERSAGPDTTAWQPVGTAAAGPGSYQLSDPGNPSGLRYYRLGLRRPDGSTDYAAPLLLTPEATEVVLFPNPVLGNELRIQYPAGTAATLNFRIYDEVGRLCQASPSAVLPGLNLLGIGLGGLRPGFYLLVWQDEGGKRRSRPFVRQ